MRSRQPVLFQPGRGQTRSRSARRNLTCFLLLPIAGKTGRLSSGRNDMGSARIQRAGWRFDACCAQGRQERGDTLPSLIGRPRMVLA
jgi:hypothetical protein